MPVIDAHHHFWRYNAREFGWIDEPMRAIRRDFLPADLKPEMHAAGVDGVVSVQARQSLTETEWLLDLAKQNDFIRGVVGWVPLMDAQVGRLLEKLAADKKLRAVRHVLQGEPDERHIRHGDFNRGVSLLGKFGLAYDILIFERQLPPALELVDRHPGQIFILDHVAKPRIKENILEPWRQNIRELARRPNVYCKISGLVTEADYAQWTEQQLEPYLEVALEAFGPRRLMVGSDWPVCLVACGYARWFGSLRRWLAKLSAAEQQRMFGGTAMEAYKL